MCGGAGGRGVVCLGECRWRRCVGVEDGRGELEWVGACGRVHRAVCECVCVGGGVGGCFACGQGRGVCEWEWG